MFNALVADAATYLAEGEFSTVLEQIKGMLSDFTTSNLLAVIGVALGVGVVLFLTWFGYRFIKKQAVKGITKGKL